MSFISIENVRISGISACVPQKVEECKDFTLFSDTDAENFSKTTELKEEG